MNARVALASSLLALVACSWEPGGPEYAEIGLRTLDASGTEARRDCFALPVLPGGVVDETVELAPGLGAHVHNEQESADIALSGTNDPASAHVTVTKETLLSGYSKTLSVTTTSGAAYSVVVLSPCVPPVPKDGGS